MKLPYSLYKPQDNLLLLRSEKNVGFYYLSNDEEDKTKAKY